MSPRHPGYTDPDGPVLMAPSWGVSAQDANTPAYLRMNAATTALEVAQAATTRNTSDVWLCASMKWPIMGSPSPAKR